MWGEATTQRVGTRKKARVRSRCRFSGFTNPACPLRVQRQTREQAYQRVRSVLIQQMKTIEGRNLSVHAAFESVVSGQLRFLGSTGLIPQIRREPAFRRRHIPVHVGR